MGSAPGDKKENGAVNKGGIWLRLDLQPYSKLNALHSKRILLNNANVRKII